MIDRSYSPLTSEALFYCCRQLAQRIGGNIEQNDDHTSIMGIPLQYSQHVQAEQSPSITVIPCAKDAWQQLLEKHVNSLSWVPAEEAFPYNADLALHAPIPILFWGEGYEDGSKPFAERREDGTVIFYADIIAATFFMLTRWEEAVSPVRDQHDRFPATASVAYKQGFLDRPIVDEYALILQAWLKTLLPGWEPEPPRFSVKLSHDIDHVHQFANLRQAGRTLLGDILKRHNLRQAWQSLQAGVDHALRPEEHPYVQAIIELAALSEEQRLRGAFYFMAAQPSQYDPGYDPGSTTVRRCIATLRQRGHEVGFHPGYQTPVSVAHFHREKQRMDAVLGETHYGGRQHYLRFHAPQTWRVWEEAGMSYDSTVGYADYEGFRCGTCHPFQPFDIEQDRVLDLWEIPLIVMEGTLKQYRNLTPEQGEERILGLAQRCNAVNGIFTLLWHNTSLHDEWAPWAAMYRRVLPQLAVLEERPAPLAENEVL